MISYIVYQLIHLYAMIMFVYVILSWFPRGSVIERLEGFLAPVCEPYLGLFRRFIPPLGMIDFSPVIAIIALEFVGNFVVRLLGFLF